MKRVLYSLTTFGLLAFFLFGCSSDPGPEKLARFYREKTAAVKGAAEALAAARNSDQAAAELEKGFKILREAVTQEALMNKQRPRTTEPPEITELQGDYLAASEKFSREVEALPKRLPVDRRLIEALKKVSDGSKPN